ncbi:MAG: prephenate dehydrogenase [Treponemataceae bacterium]|nr:prephenate dehydrogenase [Treponemataceae bacterium]
MNFKKLNEMTYGFVGLGLMGGSLAKAIRKYVLGPQGKIYAFTRKESALIKAKELNVIDDYMVMKDVNDACDKDDPNGIKKMLSECDFVFVNLPPQATIQFLLQNENFFKESSIVTEIAGVKTGVFKAFPHGIKNVNFIPGHPMAGNEREGFDHSDAEVFQGRNYIFMPYEDTDSMALDLFKEMTAKIGFTNQIVTDWKTHDHKIAFTSQLCHVIASALVDCAEDTQVTQFGGGSFEDLTRIALINAPLWTELFISNKEELISHIENFEKSLDKIKNQIKNEDADELKETLTEVRNRRAMMAQYMKKK